MARSALSDHGGCDAQKSNFRSRLTIDELAETALNGTIAEAIGKRQCCFAAFDGSVS
jgi:hypothetical protein